MALDALPAAGAPGSGLGRRLLVTRPQPQADAWVAELQALGVSACALPLLSVADASDADAVRQAQAELHDCALVMFVSPTAVLRWHALAPSGWAWPAGVLAGSTGPGTAAALASVGVPASAIVTPAADGGRFDSEALWADLRQRRSWQGAQVQVVRGEGGRDWLADQMRAAGASVRFVEAYRRTPPQLAADGQRCLAAALAAPAAHAWLFSSSEAIGHLPGLAPAFAWSTSTALCTHPRIAEAATQLGFGQVLGVLPTPAAVAQGLGLARP